MYEVLARMATRPDPYSLMTVKDLWTRPHVARQMLAYHLDQGTSLASRPVADYLNDDLPIGFDVVTLIYYDFCALPPADRRHLLRRIHSMLNPGGKLVMDVVAESAFPQAGEQLAIEENLMGGFWSDSDYVGAHRTWLYADSKLSLDHYVIVEPNDHWEILNWMQYFSPGHLVGELEDAGYVVRTRAASLTGDTLTDSSREIALITERTS